MNKTIKIISVFACVLTLISSITAYAADDKIITSGVAVKTNRLFEVKIGINSNRTITAARFTLTYNKNDVSVRKAVCNLSTAKVKFNDKNGSTDIIFLCSSGVKCSDFPTLFSMTYKKINDNNTKITIKASDCVDNNIKNFTPPKSAVCNITADTKAGSDGSDNPFNNDNYDDSEDFLETSGNDDYADIDDERVFTGEDEPDFLKFIPIILLVVILMFFALILHQNILLKKAEKRREEEKEQNINQD